MSVHVGFATTFAVVVTGLMVLSAVFLVSYLYLSDGPVWTFDSNEDRSQRRFLRDSGRYREELEEDSSNDER
jgi:hypothetical protein